MPIIALTVRPAEDVEGGARLSSSAGEEEADQSSGGPLSRTEDLDIEGVFLVENGQVRFVAVEIGITGQEHFELLSGIAAGDTIVAGPYQQIRDLVDGDRVQDEDESLNALFR